MTADEVFFLLQNLQKKNYLNIFVLDLVPYWLFFVYRCERLSRYVKRNVYQKKR